MTEPTTIRDALEAAVPADDTVDAPAPEPINEPVSEPAMSAEPSVVSEPVKDAPKPDGRDDKGRFKSKEDKPPVAPEATAEPAAEPAQGIQPGPKSEPKAAPQERAPASWRPDVREHWSKLPPEVRAEVARREREMQTTLQETAEARRFTEQLQGVIRPYEMFIKAEGSNPLQAIDNLMATAAKLRTGTAPELAQLVAGMVKQYGVGRFGQNFIESLDAALAGEVPQADPVQSQVQQVLQQQLAPVQQFMSQFQQAQLAQQQRAQQEAASEVQQFLDRAEFGNDVREEMADILEVAERRGRELSLQDAYKQACLVNPRVRAVLEQRAKARGAQQLTGAAQKARAAAVSVSGGPTLSAPKGGAADVRSAIEAAIAANSR
jgi:hypothetical protein